MNPQERLYPNKDYQTWSYPAQWHLITVTFSSVSSTRPTYTKAQCRFSLFYPSCIHLQIHMRQMDLSWFLITLPHRNSQCSSFPFNLSHYRDLPGKSSGNDSNKPTFISMFLFLIHFILLLILVNRQLKSSSVLFAEMAHCLWIHEA